MKNVSTHLDSRGQGHPTAAASAENKRNANELEQTQQWLRMLIDSAEDYAIFSISPHGKIAIWSQGATKLFGYQAEEIVDQDFAIIFTPEDRANGVPEQEIECAQREGYSPDIRWHQRKDGSRLFVSGCVRPLRGKDQQNYGFLKVAHDITEQRQIEHNLRESEQLYRLLVENVKDFALFTFDASGCITHWNPGAECLLGYSEAEILGQSVDCLYTVEDQKAGLPARERAKALREGVSKNDAWLVRKDGTRLFVIDVVRRMEDHEGKVLGFVKVAHNITAKKQLEDELRSARDHLETVVAERTSQLKETIGELESFSYSVSHDLRAPLRTMQGFAELLQAKFGDKLGLDGGDWIKRIITAASRADQLIRDVLTLSHVARETIHLEPVDIEGIVWDIIGGTPEFQAPQVQITVVSPLQKVLGHSARLSQCFSNLLWNAVKFVPEGVTPQIKVWTETVGRHVRVWVEDNGIGIPREQQERIFGLFQRLHNNEVYKGTGVGLAIVRKAVERMNGKVGVESEPGKGSRFWFDLPPIAA